MQVVAGGCGWLQMVADGCGWLRASACCALGRAQKAAHTCVLHPLHRHPHLYA
jgi:hypothetical protein